MDILKVTQKQRNIHVVTVKPKHTIKTLQISDIQFDSVKCDRALLKRHLKQAEEKQAFVVMNGDIFDVMGCANDPRSSYSDIRSEYLVTNYLDAVVEDAINFFSKFNVTYFIGRGNHETNIYKRQHTDVTRRLCDGLKAKGLEVYDGGYSGWIVYQLQLNDKSGRNSIKQFYHHGYGGNASRSKGALKVDINMKNHPDADIITTGHDHQKWFFPISIQRLSHEFKIREETVYNIDTGSYKYLGDGYAGWATEKGFNNPTLGGWWIDIGLKKRKTILTKNIEVYEAR